MSDSATSLNKSQTSYLQLRDDLITCRIAPDTKLVINELAERFGVNLGAMREALARLASEGLVKSESQKGFRAAPVSIADLKDLTKTRIHIESLCLRSALENGDVEWETNIVASFHRLMRTSEFEDDDFHVSEDWVNAHAKFHFALVSGCENTWLLKLQRHLYSQAERYRRLSIPIRLSETTLITSHKSGQERDHKLLMEGALDRDYEKMKNLIARHYQQTADIVTVYASSSSRGSIFSPDEMADTRKR